MHLPIPRLGAWTFALFALVLVTVPMSAGAAKSQPYVVTPLVSNGGVPAAHTDPQLVNGWGLVARGTSPWWVADNGTDVSTLYDGTGNKQSLVVTVDGGPTGEVANTTSSFVVRSGASAGPSFFIWASEDGKIRGWNPGVPPPPPSTQAQVGVDNSGVGAIYKGLAIATGPVGPELYATDFHNAKVDVYDGAWNPVNIPGAFVDPKLPKHYAPFGIQTIGTRIFVTYARQDKAREDERAGHGKGFVDVYDTAGTLLGRVASRDDLNAPWGLAMASPSFGEFANDLLVGNFGDGRITAYEQQPNGSFKDRGQLRGVNGKPLEIDGLWALEVSTGGNNGTPGTLYFTAGPNDENDGLFGTITPG
jgi:uncharacterized protein (TIGR03118 family)